VTTEQQQVALLRQGRVMEALKIAQAAMDSNPQRFDPHQRLLDDVRSHNATEGNLHLVDGIFCAECKNRGNIAVVLENPRFNYKTFAIQPCKCMEARRSLELLKNSGLANLSERYTLEQFTTEAPWHQDMKQKAIDYIEGRGAQWFFAGGQVGCGKSHICTAITLELIRKGHSTRYMLWRDESTRLKALVNDDELYNEEISKLKRVDVLYIDDLFKMQRNDRNGQRNTPTAADINLAFEIINARYMDESKKTIISCEWFIDDLVDFDEGVASRIYERSKASCAEISRDPKKNYRLH